MSKNKALEIDGIFGSQGRDTQGETLSVEGADISELEAGRGRFNDNHSKGFGNTLGRITFAKKIFKEEDCEDDRQRYYWNKIKTPYIYGRGILFDDEDHYNAKACAAILRNIHKTDCPLQLKLSVEGGVIARGIADPSFLARTKIVACAITFSPANNATLVEPLNLDKSATSWEADLNLIKSVLHLAQTNVPSFRHITRDAQATKVQENLIKIAELAKEAGLEGEIIIPSKNKIIEKALEDKIKSNVEKIHASLKDLSKGDVIDMFPKKTQDRKIATRAKNKINKDPIHKPNTKIGVLDEKGHWSKDKGVSEAGADIRHYNRNKDVQAEEKSYGGGAYNTHRKVLSGLKAQPKPNLTKEEDGGEHIKTCSDPRCKTDITTKNAKYLGRQEQPKSKDVTHHFDLYNCPGCNTTVVHKVPIENVEKGIKNAIAGAALGAATMMSPKPVAAQTDVLSQRAPATQNSTPNPGFDLHNIPDSHRDAYSEATKKNPLLGAMGFKETSGAANYNHPTISNPKSMHYGHTAGGMFAQMPIQAAATLKHDKELAKRYPQLVEAAKDMKNNHRVFTDTLNRDPQAATDFATSLYNHLSKFSKDPAFIAHAWNHGLSGTQKKLKEHGKAALENDPYTKDVIKKFMELKPKESQSKQALKKAMTAGYGGAGAPTSNTGGGVFQSESVEQGRPGFKYVTCDGCGHEQVHSKYQVRCRKCNEAFSLKKLEKLL